MIYWFDVVRVVTLVTLVSILGISLYIFLDAQRRHDTIERFRMASYMSFLVIAVVLIYSKIGAHQRSWFEFAVLGAAALGVRGQVAAARNRTLRGNAPRESRK